ncbi:Lrp/AsnC ligand binding domain-containing protein [Sphingomonas sp. GCM10030256]|uniref:Lrp/AsnC ligand binding domain-containing protein n=1 Tax=Sphingomonas sp. GCM10030256 TaxID=3273427 RepID=UPI00361054A7
MTTEGAAQAAEIRVILCLRFADDGPFEEITHCKQALLASPQVLHCLEVSGTFHLMVEVAVADLGAYQSLLDDIINRFGRLLAHYEANFICRRYERQNDAQSHCLWVPCAEGRQRVDCDRIDKVVAEGDYVRIVSGSSEWLLHATLTSLAHQLESGEFVQLGRSVIVRIGFIARLIHHGRRWIARLADGSQHRIAKPRTVAVMAALKAASSNGGTASAMVERLADLPLIMTEKPMH